LLTEDHRKVEKLFKEYAKAKDSGNNEEKMRIAKEVCGELLIHMEIEEKLFYPHLKQKIDEENMMNEAVVEHAGAKDLIKQLGSMEPSDPMFDAKIKVLSEEIAHHVEEEEEEMFPQATNSGLNLKALGEQLLHAKNQMRTDHGLEAVPA